MVDEKTTLKGFEDCIKDNPKVAVDFTATWCGPCKFIGPKFVEQAANFPTITFIKVDVDANKETSEKCGITAMPTFKFYFNGKEAEDLNLVGASEDKLKAHLEKLKDL